jgi:hypothetical protein
VHNFALVGIQTHTVYAAPSLDCFSDLLWEVFSCLLPNDVGNDVVSILFKADTGWHVVVDACDEDQEEKGSKHTALDNSGFDFHPLSGEIADTDALSAVAQVAGDPAY